ncbi:hypothetical protein GTY20_09125 [Streptomyces sp. SID4946]|uniref:hypothetical protein n=1 Tax=Streptomyces sp. LamerLS-31b TaxID=1839765 RepID=UPI00081DE2D2|nr:MULTISPECIES: hypothetical protein [unclassified Streptomyces]MYQ91478.1 hypothetical protein [Streptomyces sp. SID4946]SCF67813.1 hypothetical protein GA0115256_111331 [Streptomyces sp. DconLS]SCF75539.1 hypothetical protein GA0115258_11162 [Streptomyces sp. LamerLS-31b]
MPDHTHTASASASASANSYETWEALQPITRPGEVPITTPIAWMENRRGDHSLALLLCRNDPHRHGPTDALACLALGEAIRTELGHYRGSLVHDARRRGASWQQIADALDTDVPTVQQLLRDWADGQHRLYQAEPVTGRLGLSTAEHQAVLALIPDH